MNHWIPCASCNRHHEARAERCPFCVAPTHRGLALVLAFASATSLASCARAEAAPRAPQRPVADTDVRRDAGASASDAAPEAGRIDAASPRRARRPSRSRGEDVPLYGYPPK